MGVARRCARRDRSRSRTPSSRKLFDERRNATSDPETVLAAREQNARDRTHADPADADKVVGSSPLALSGARGLMLAWHKVSIRARIARRGSAPASRRGAVGESLQSLRPHGLREHRAQAPGRKLAIRQNDGRAGGVRAGGIGRLMAVAPHTDRERESTAFRVRQARRASRRRHARAPGRPPRRRRPCRPDTGRALGSRGTHALVIALTGQREAAASPPADRLFDQARRAHR